MLYLKKSFLLMIIIIFAMQLFVVALFTLYERKVMAAVQKSMGPNVIGIFGMLQPMADAIKLLLKETIFPKNANKFLFIFSSLYIFILSLVLLSWIPFNSSGPFNNSEFSLLFFFGFSSMNIFGLLLAGWASQNKYALLGSLSSCSQMISYELILSIAFLIIILFIQSVNLFQIVLMQINSCFLMFTVFPLAITFFILLLAETNRAPFDLPEAESELVAGYNLEYSSLIFAFFFLGEYSNIMNMSALYSLLFLGGWGLPIIGKVLMMPMYYESFFFSIKILLIIFLFMLISACFPRFSYDQLLFLCWKFMLPLLLMYFYMMIILFYFFFLMY